MVDFVRESSNEVEDAARWAQEQRKPVLLRIHEGESYVLVTASGPAFDRFSSDAAAIEAARVSQEYVGEGLLVMLTVAKNMGKSMASFYKEVEAQRCQERIEKIIQEQFPDAVRLEY